MTPEEKEEAQKKLIEWIEKHPDASQFDVNQAYAAIVAEIETPVDVTRELEWRESLRLKLRSLIHRVNRPEDLVNQPLEMQEKLELLYKELMTDINLSEAPEDIKTGLDPLPAIIGPLLYAAGGGALGMLMASLLGPYVTSKLTYPMNKQAQPYRLPPDVVFRLWWKLYKGFEPPKELLDNLRDQGWSEKKIEDGKEASKVMPTPADIIMFLAHEVFEPDMIEKYGLDSEWEGIDKEYAKKIGLDEETLKNYWRNHWVHPSLTSVYDMLHRDLITEKDVAEYYRLVEVPEYWRDNLTELSWDMPNRIEIRMMARYLDLDKAFVKDMLKKAGLHADYRDAGADFMLVMGLQGYWSTMYRNGWLSAEGLLDEIKAKELDPVIAERVYKYIVKAEKPERTKTERDLTKADIYKGVKKEVISWGQGVEFLQILGYDEFEADFILSINVPREEIVTEVKRRELTKTDILKGLKAEVITESEALKGLMELRYIASDAEFLLSIFKASAKPPVEPREREASKADILAGVKKGLITPKEGYLMLQDIGFSPEASSFILEVRVEESPFSPVTPFEFKRLVDAQRRAMGEEVKEIPQEVIDAEKAFVSVSARLKEAYARDAEQAELDNLEVEKAEAGAKYRELLILHGL